MVARGASVSTMAIHLNKQGKAMGCADRPRLPVFYGMAVLKQPYILVWVSRRLCKRCTWFCGPQARPVHLGDRGARRWDNVFEVFDDALGMGRGCVGGQEAFVHVLLLAVAVRRRVHFMCALVRCLDVERVAPVGVDAALGLLNGDGEQDHVEEPKHAINAEEVQLGRGIVLGEPEDRGYLPCPTKSSNSRGEEGDVSWSSWLIAHSAWKSVMDRVVDDRLRDTGMRAGTTA